MLTKHLALMLLLLIFATSYSLEYPDCNDLPKLYKAGKLYKMFGVDKTATTKDIKRGFKKMSVKCHPDKDRENDKASDNFVALSGAYETLGNEEERRKFDRYGGGSSQKSQWKPKNFKDINVDEILKQFFGQFQDGFFSEGSQHFGTFFGDNEDEDDTTFSSIFKSFKTKTTMDSNGFGNVFGGMDGIFGSAMKKVFSFDAKLDGFKQSVGDSTSKLKEYLKPKHKKNTDKANKKKQQKSKNKAKIGKDKKKGCRFHIIQGEICD